MATTNQIRADELREAKEKRANDAALKTAELREMRRKNDKEHYSRQREASRKEKMDKHNRTMDWARGISSGVKFGVDNFNKNINRGLDFIGGAITKSVPTNDPEWYKKNPGLFRDATALQFDTALGYHTDVKPENVNGDTIAGIATMHILPTYGTSRDASSILNMAKNEQYQWVRYMNNGHTNYEATDLFQVLLAMDGLATVYAFMRRSYALLMSYEVENRYVAKHLFEKNGLDFEDFHKNIVDYRAFIANWAMRANQFAVPHLGITKRHMAMFASIYSDQPFVKSQLYMCVPDAFPIYDWENKAIALKRWSIQGSDSTMSYDAFVEYANSFIAALAENEDVAIMAGDVRKAYTDAKLITFDTEIEPNQYLTPIYDEWMLSSFENALVTGILRDYDAPYVTQVGTALVCDPVFNLAGPVDMYEEHLHLNFHKREVTADDIIEATRLLPAGVSISPRDGTGDKWSGTFKSLPLDVITYFTLSYFKPNGALGNADYTSAQFICAAESQDTNWGSDWRRFCQAVALFSVFYHLPAQHIIYMGGPTDTLTAWTVSLENVASHTDMPSYANGGDLFQQLDTVAPLSVANVMNLNNAAALSLFYVEKGDK